MFITLRPLLSRFLSVAGLVSIRMKRVLPFLLAGLSTSSLRCIELKTSKGILHTEYFSLMGYLKCVWRSSMPAFDTPWQSTSSIRPLLKAGFRGPLVLLVRHRGVRELREQVRVHALANDVPRFRRQVAERGGGQAQGGAEQSQGLTSGTDRRRRGSCREARGDSVQDAPPPPPPLGRVRT